MNLPVGLAFRHVSLKELEREHIFAVLIGTRGNISKASKILGISRPGLYSKLRIHKLENIPGRGPVPLIAA